MPLVLLVRGACTAGGNDDDDDARLLAVAQPDAGHDDNTQALMEPHTAAN